VGCSSSRNSSLVMSRGKRFESARRLPRYPGVSVSAAEYQLAQLIDRHLRSSLPVTQHHRYKMPMGGHFAAIEEPELLAEDIRTFLRPLR
jgi:hypothetical protein